MLDHLSVSAEKILKCCANLILGCDNACDKVFKNIEQKIVHKLLEIAAGDKAFASPGTSIHTIDQISISKLLSPSHAAHSVSLYCDYITWMDAQEIPHKGFKGFQSNRFGRIADTAKEFLTHRDSILSFFDTVVDPNANKLVLAVSTYIQNKWFLCCSEVYSRLGNDIIFPLMDLLGIDKRTHGPDDERSWEGVRDFFLKKLPELERVKANFSPDNGQEQLYAAVLDDVLDTLRRQLAEMDFFTDYTDSAMNKIKLEYAPLTNLGCEGEFAKLDNRLKISGGSTSVQTLSRKNIIKTNNLLVDSEFTELSDTERVDKWKWARTSEEVKQAKKLENDFIATVKFERKLSLLKKEQLKRKKIEKTMRLLETCKMHSGPVTEYSLNILTDLNEKQLISEISYLRATLAPNIRQQRRIKAGGSYKMEKFSIDELRTSIKNALKPESNITSDVDQLLMDALRRN